MDEEDGLEAAEPAWTYGKGDPEGSMGHSVKYSGTVTFLVKKRNINSLFHIMPQNDLQKSRVLKMKHKI